MSKKPLYKGYMWKLFGYCQMALPLLMVLVPLLFMAEPIESGSVPSIAVVIYLVALSAISYLAYYSGPKSIFKGKKIIAAALPSPLTHDARRPIVYLRSFQDDTTAAQLHPPPQPPPSQPGGVAYSYYNPNAFLTEEEELAAVMNEIGPFVAIGCPGEELPELGAYRTYVQQEDWQEKVRNLISIAQLVIIRLGMTEGVLWELRTAIKHVEAKRLLLLVPWEKSQYAVFRNTYATLFPAGLPEYGASRWFPGNSGSLRGIICFWPGWTPHFLGFKGSFLYAETVEVTLKKTLLPVFNRLDLSYKPLTVTVSWFWKLVLFVVVGIPTILLSIALLVALLVRIGNFLYETLSLLGAILCSPT
jgi:hypothetical protein